MIVPGELGKIWRGCACGLFLGICNVPALKLQSDYSLVRIWVLTASMKMAVFWDVAPRILLDTGRRFRGAYYLYNQGDFYSLVGGLIVSKDRIASIFKAESMIEVRWVITTYNTIRSHNLEGHSRHLHRREKLKFQSG
jgi:hypothetical protein